MRQFYDTGAARLERINSMLTEHKQIANAGIRPSRHGLEEQGFRNLNVAYWNLGTAQLLEHAIQRREGNLASGGSFVVRTGQFTGRSPKDKFIVRDETTDAHVNWGDVNQPLSAAHFDRLYSKMMAFWQGHDVYVQDCFVGADPEYGMPIRVVSQLAWHNLFARQLFIRPDPEKTGDHKPQFSILFAPDFQANPAEDGTNSETCIVINFKKRVVLICGTSYAGEMKKSAFTILNYLLPDRGVFPMHCSANIGTRGRRRALLRTLRNRQDHPLGGSRTQPDRRRRARLERQRRLQFRGRLLRQVHSPLPRERTADLERHPLRHRAGERCDGFGDPPAGFQLRRGHREHPRRLSAEVHPQRRDSERGRTSQPHHLPDRRCVRRAAADFQALAGAGDVSFSERLYRQGGGYRARTRQRAAGHLQRLFRRALPAASGGRLRVPVGRETPPPRRAGLAGEYRLGRRAVRRRRAYEAALSPAPCSTPPSTVG